MTFDAPLPLSQDPTYLRHQGWMIRALELAETAGKAGEVPVGAVIIGPNNQVLAEAANCRERCKDPTGHAEILALRAAGQRLGSWRLQNCTLYVTLEPCPMCAGALIQGRLGLLVYGADDPKTGAVRSVLNLPDGPASNHRLAVLGGVLAEACQAQLQAWFAHKRA